MNFRALSFLLSASLLSAEILTLSTDDQFEGKLISISPTEGVVMGSPRSPVAIPFRADSFTRLELSGPQEADPFQTERLVLANGDILPGNLRSLDESTLVYEGLVGGVLNLERTQVNTLRFGIKPQSLAYSGPDPLAEWSGDGAETWTMMSNEGLLLVERGQIAKNVQLGSQFKIQFRLKWDERPSVRVYFGCDLEQTTPHDRYYIDVNKAGVQIRRERSTEPRFHMLVNLSQSEAFDDGEVEVEIQVNRLLGTIDLYLDGKLVRQMQDAAPPTTGDGIIIERNNSDNSACLLSDLRVYDWDAVSQIELLEETGNQDTDSLVDAEGKRISGSVLGMVSESTDEEAESDTTPSFFLLKSPFADEPVQIPTQQARIIYFKETEQEKVATDFPKYELDIANDGVVSAEKIWLSDNEVKLTHPLLGEVKVPRSAVKSIRFLNKLQDEEE